ncbi:hypothetical protein G6F56_012081 [Rhizopus delemar]|nr:hypothetical protein G6F56_012081 [Rhizopus delemar]
MYLIQDKDRNESIDTKCETPFREIRFHYKLQEEHSHTIKDSGVFGVFIQQQDHDYFSPNVEDFKLDKENQTSDDIAQEVVQMDSRSIGEDDLDDTGSRRSSTTYQVLTKGSVEDITPNTPKLGNNLQLVKYQPGRVTLVGDLHNTEEWITNSEDSSNQPDTTQEDAKTQQSKYIPTTRQL